MRAIALAEVVFCTGLLAGTTAYAKNKVDKKVVRQLKTDITYLASDSLEGRRTSTEGERKAAAYIEKRYKALKIAPYKGQYLHPFQFIYGKEATPATQIRINHTPLVLQEEVFPLPFSASKQVANDVMPDVMEQGNIWLAPLYADKDQAGDPHFDAEKHMYEKAKDAERQGATGMLFYDSYGSKYPATFNRHSELETLGIPVACLTAAGNNKLRVYTAAEKNILNLEMDITIVKAERTGNNVAAFIDNKAPLTVVIGAHYDHLGYGEDANSLHANAAKDHLIHHGADDNASGTAGLMEVAKWVKNHKLRKFNYLFVHFSGEELGLFGSKMFVKEEKLDSNAIAYMLNMDMIGRLNDSTHALTVGGIGTSPSWADIPTNWGKDYKITIDSSGVGPSDHTSFYHAGIPVLFLFTGTHKDYHKPTDVAELVNYTGEAGLLAHTEDLLATLDKAGTKPSYRVTKQATGGRTAFKVTLGIMPDYTAQVEGLRVDGVSDNRPAAKAGVLQGDIIVRLGTYKIGGIQSYMEALGKFTPGDKAEIVVLRDGKEQVMIIEFAAKK